MRIVVLSQPTKACGADIPTIQCCDTTTGQTGLACCGSTPYNPEESSCCGDESIVTGNNTSVCAPSTEPSTSPSLFPTSAPSDRHTCEKVDPCKYDLEEDEMGGYEIAEIYFPVCIQEGDNKYHQECYKNSTIFGLGEGDPDPENKGRTIVNCGCCPSEEDLPEEIKDVKGSTDVCEDNGTLDCVLADTAYDASGKKIEFEMCIDGEIEYNENFYTPKKNEIAYCGSCDDIRN